MDFKEQILAANPADVHVANTEYFQWLNTDNNYADHPMQSSLNYLEEVYEFRMGIDVATEPTLERLRLIHDLYFHAIRKADITYDS